MDCKEEIVDSRIPDPKAFEIGTRNALLVFKLNHTMPMTEEYAAVVGSPAKVVRMLEPDKFEKE